MPSCNSGKQMGQTDTALSKQVFTAKNLRSHPSVWSSWRVHLERAMVLCWKMGETKNENLQFNIQCQGAKRWTGLVNTQINMSSRWFWIYVLHIPRRCLISESKFRWFYIWSLDFWFGLESHNTRGISCSTPCPSQSPSASPTKWAPKAEPCRAKVGDVRALVAGWQGALGGGVTVGWEWTILGKYSNISWGSKMTFL